MLRQLLAVSIGTMLATNPTIQFRNHTYEVKKVLDTQGALLEAKDGIGNPLRIYVVGNPKNPVYILAHQSESEKISAATGTVVKTVRICEAGPRLTQVYHQAMEDAYGKTYGQSLLNGTLEKTDYPCPSTLVADIQQITPDAYNILNKR